MMRDFLISQIKESAELLGRGLSEKEIKRLDGMMYSKIVQEADFARLAVMLQVQNEQAQLSRELIEQEKLKMADDKQRNSTIQ
ncbi:hypothetical protein KUA25_06075 [Bacteroidales bacterium MSK.15.36]|nr:hypothetical protein [Bacteroidales bacterium MSK.15.36]